MSAEEIRQAADDLISHIARGGTPRLWWMGKDLSDEDRERVLEEAAASRGRSFR